MDLVFVFLIVLAVALFAAAVWKRRLIRKRMRSLGPGPFRTLPDSSFAGLEAIAGSNGDVVLRLNAAIRIFCRVGMADNDHVSDMIRSQVVALSNDAVTKVRELLARLQDAEAAEEDAQRWGKATYDPNEEPDEGGVLERPPLRGEGSFGTVRFRLEAFPAVAKSNRTMLLALRERITDLERQISGTG